jgi:hypothetical protein
MLKRLRVGIVAVAMLVPAAGAFAQEPASASTICGQPVPAPASLPPDGSAPVVYLLAPCFLAQGNTALVDLQTYLYYIQTKSSVPSRGVWVPYTEDT